MVVVELLRVAAPTDAQQATFGIEERAVVRFQPEAARPARERAGGVLVEGWC